MVDVIYKKCSRCWIERELNAYNFHRERRHKDWFRSECKACAKIEHDEKAEQRRMQSKRWRENNKEHVLETQAKYRLEHKEQSHQYYLDNKEEILKKNRAYYKVRKEWHNNYTRQYYKDHKEEVTKRIVKNRKEKWFDNLHQRTWRFMKKYNLRPDTCSICWSKEFIYAHHPSNDIRNEVVLCCKSCHQRIHSWAVQCPEPIDLLKLI